MRGLSPTDRSSHQGGLGADPVEYGRSAIAAFSYVEPNQAREVHILRLRAAFERVGITPKLRWVLNVLRLMREVEDLGGGYWFPTPLRCVRIGDLSLVLSPSPTHELRRHLPQVRRAGYARIIDDRCVSGFPHQPLGSWMGLDITDSAAWVRDQLARVDLRMAPTLAPEHTQFLGFASRRVAGSHVRFPSWGTNPSTAARPAPGVALCRQGVGGESSRYFWGRLSGGRVTDECAVDGDVARVVFGLAAHTGGRLMVRVKAMTSDTLFELPSPCYLPRAERRLALAVARMERSQNGRTYRVNDESLASAFASSLRALGCELKILDV